MERTMKVYGLAEIAAQIGVPRGTVRQWHARGKLPPPTDTLLMGPVWSSDVILPWIRSQRKAKR